MEQKLNSVTSAETNDDSSTIADVTTSSPNNAKPNVSGSADFWANAVEFSKKLVVDDIEDKFVSYVKEQNFNHNEILLFRKLLADAIEMNFIVGQLKHCH